MPTIPRLSTPSVDTVGIATPRVQAPGADAFGAQLGNAFSGAGAKFAEIARQEQDKANLTTAQDATLFFDKLSKEADAAIRATQGSEAFGDKDNPSGITSTILDDFDRKAADYIQKNTSNNVQSRYAFNLHQERRNTLEHTGLTHALTERTKYEDNAFTSSQKSTLDQIALYAADPGKQKEFERAVAFGAANIEAYANLRNWSQESLDEKHDEWMANAYKVKAIQMMSKNPVAAKAFIEENKETLGSEYTQLKQSVDLIAAEQLGIGAAEEISPRLYKEDYTELRTELFKKFGGGTESFDAKSFKIAEAQLAANNQAITIARKQNIEKLQVPILKAILEVEKTGGKMSPKQLGQIPEYQEMMASGDFEVVKAASTIMDKVFTENNALIQQARAEARFNRSMRQSEQAGLKEAQRLAWMDLYGDPDKVASMSEVEVLQAARQLGTYGDDLIKMHRKATSPEALAEIKVEASTFKSVMEQLKVPKEKQGQIQEAMKGYLIREQQDNKRILNKDQIRSAIGAAIQEVSVNERQSFLGINMGTTTTKKRLFEVGNQEAIIIPKDINDQKITPLLNAYGIADNRRNRVRIYKELLAIGGKK